ncbi:EME1 [Candida pseudojiufengensis]|uniref:EME1 n=1 Tax=Candida pseudojiufengensis TaxID=497109 RepID=UPI0022249A0B|nr:EME1 [Candida pseudojiufengensis]KAI5963003.1 EME1 [Candida pseudojiufengensis]
MRIPLSNGGNSSNSGNSTDVKFKIPTNSTSSNRSQFNSSSRLNQHGSSATHSRKSTNVGSKSSIHNVSSNSIPYRSASASSYVSSSVPKYPSSSSGTRYRSSSSGPRYSSPSRGRYSSSSSGPHYQSEPSISYGFSSNPHYQSEPSSNYNTSNRQHYQSGGYSSVSHQHYGSEPSINHNTSSARYNQTTGPQLYTLSNDPNYGVPVIIPVHVDNHNTSRPFVNLSSNFSPAASFRNDSSNSHGLTDREMDYLLGTSSPLPGINNVNQSVSFNSSIQDVNSGFVSQNHSPIGTTGFGNDPTNTHKGQATRQSRQNILNSSPLPVNNRVNQPLVSHGGNQNKNSVNTQKNSIPIETPIIHLDDSDEEDLVITKNSDPIIKTNNKISPAVETFNATTPKLSESDGIGTINSNSGKRTNINVTPKQTLSKKLEPSKIAAPKQPEEVVIIELSDDDESEIIKPIIDTRTNTVGDDKTKCNSQPINSQQDTAIIILDSDEEDEPKPHSSSPGQCKALPVSSPVHVMKAVDSDPIFNSTFSFSKVSEPNLLENVPPAKELPKLPVVQDLPKLPAFVNWLSSDDEDENETTINLAKQKSFSKSSPVKSLISKAETSQNKDNSSKTIVSTINRPTTTINVQPLKRANTTQNSEIPSSQPKKAKRSKTDTLLAELPKINNHEFTSKELQLANRVSRKKDELHEEMEIWINKDSMDLFEDEKEEFKSTVSESDFELPIVFWKRNVTAEYIKEKDYFIPCTPKKVVQKTFILYYLAQDFVTKLSNDVLKQEVLQAEKLMCEKSVNKYHIIVMVECYDQLINKLKAYKQRQFRTQVLSGMNVDEQNKRKKSDDEISILPEHSEIEKMINKIQLDLKINIFTTRSRSESLMWLNSFTYTIASSLYDKYERNEKLANLGTVKSGSDAKATFIRSMQHFTRMTQQKAEILHFSYKTMHQVYHKLRADGTLGKDSAGRNIVPPTVDNAMLNFFTSDDPNKAIN